MENRYEEFSLLIVGINRYFQKIKSYEMANLGLKGGHVQCLYYLSKNEEGLTFSELCELCEEDKGAMSRCIKELEMCSYVYVEEKKAQKYKNPIRLTDKGSEVSKIVNEKINEIFLSGSEGVDKEDRENFYNVLKKVYENMAKISKTYKE